MTSQTVRTCSRIWSEGARVCPGKKFSQVEYIALIAVLFRSHRVFPVIEGQESEADARQRALAVTMNSHYFLTLRMSDPGKVALAWRPI